jgi:hypothetical protein
MVRKVALAIAKLVVAVYAIAVLLYAVPVVLGSLDDGMRVNFDRADPATALPASNGLSPEQRAKYYHLSQGSEILPWMLLTAIEVADPNSTKPFIENLTRFGLLPDPARNDGLAIGLSLASNAYTFGMEFVGVTCAACHVSELRYGGRTMRVDGAPNMLNLQLFYSEAIEALFSTLRDTGKLWRALKRLGRQDFERYNVAAPFIRPALLAYYGINVALNREKLKARLELVSVIRKAKELRDPAHPTSGFGRLDAFDGTRNFLLTRLRKEDAGGTFEVNPANMVKLDAPTKFPQLWSQKAAPLGDVATYYADPAKFPQVFGFKDYLWLEWTLNTDTVLERNFTETLGAGATVVLDPAAGTSLFNSSISINNLHDLEWLTYYIDPPRWPAALFGPVNAAMVERGKALFSDQCAGCHEYNRSQDRTETGLLKLRGFRPADIGTDPATALRISCPVPDTGAISVPPRTLTREQTELLKDCAGVKAGAEMQVSGFAAVTQKVVDEIKKKAYAAEGIDAASRRKIEDLDRRKKVVWRDTLLDTTPPEGPYAARPLHGIWAAAPYLHNGSVPTLYDLLLPPEQRPKKFALGAREFDPKKVGFAVTTTCTGQDCLVDTSLPGSANSGHSFGTALGETERADLIEFLKTYGDYEKK